MLRKVSKAILWILAIMVFVIVGLAIYIRFGTTAPVPQHAGVITEKDSVIVHASGLRTLRNNWFRKSESGLFEMYVEGKPFERGLVAGRLSRDLVRYQELVFTKKLEEFVPSSFYRTFLKYSIQFFNRRLPDAISEEFKEEIYGVSLSADPAFDHVGPAYQRMLSYHAAHDIGHALQNISLVGCTSFATWGDASADSSLIVARNFDFTLGEQFSRDKIIAFYRPEAGHKFMMVTFGGMTGVLSGMNDAGLTVTLNSAKSEIPNASATPVSLVAREILQYATTIKEAYAIAEKRKMFVAESFLIGSANDGKASLIEKTPESIDLYESGENHIISTNHFQGSPLGETVLNRDHMKTSSSVYRYSRVEELLSDGEKNSVVKSAQILRDRSGLRGADIGLGNEKSINQLVAHHSIIFQPEKGRVWVSTSDWQLGKYVCYDLNKVFADNMKADHEIVEPGLTILADPFSGSADFKDFMKFSPYRYPFSSKKDLIPDSVVLWNSNSYLSWMLAGDKCFDERQYQRAVGFYQKALTLEIATQQEKEHMEKNISMSQEKLR